MSIQNTFCGCGGMVEPARAELNLKICKSDKLVVYDVKGILDKNLIDARL